MTTPLPEEQWLSRCAARLQERAELNPVVAMDIAKSQLENLNGDLTENPEEAAEAELSYWTAD